MVPSTVYWRRVSRTASSCTMTQNSERVREPSRYMVITAWPISLRWAAVVSRPLSASRVSSHSIAQARSPLVSRNCNGQKARRSSSAATVKWRPERPLLSARMPAASGYMDMPLSNAKIDMSW
ncbi:hypothetical protein D9M71_300580 [compost metagenome]